MVDKSNINQTHTHTKHVYTYTSTPRITMVQESAVGRRDAAAHTPHVRPINLHFHGLIKFTSCASDSGAGLGNLSERAVDGPVSMCGMEGEAKAAYAGI